MPHERRGGLGEAAGIGSDEHDAKAAWDIYAAVLPDKITARCGGCALVGDAYAEFLEAKGTRRGGVEQQ